MTSLKNMLIALVLFSAFLIVGFELSANIETIKKLNPTLSNDYIIELNNAFDLASKTYNIDKDLLISIAFLESSFKSGVEGDGGRSLGIMQIGRQGRRACGYGESVKDQIMSGSCWLNHGINWCGSIKGGLTAYACGSCTPTNYRCKQAVKRRLKLQRGLK